MPEGPEEVHLKPCPVGYKPAGSWNSTRNDSTSICWWRFTSPTGPGIDPLSYSVARCRLSRPAQPRMRSSAVTRRWPSSAVATIRRSAGSAWKSARLTARIPISPLIATSTTPCSNCSRRQRPTSPGNRIRPLSFSIATSQNEIAETPTSPDCHAWSISSRALGPNRATPNLIHSMTLVSKLVKIGAKVVRHGRYVTFQLAEVAVPRSLFQKILRLIDGLRGRPAPA